MRIISFTKKWDKLKELRFTTLRFPRKDKDWQVGEAVQVYYRTRSPDREYIGEATIVGKEQRAMTKYGDKTGCQLVSEQEAIEDGFQPHWNKYCFKEAYFWMYEFLWDRYGGMRLATEPMNKLTLEYIGVRVK